MLLRRSEGAADKWRADGAQVAACSDSLAVLGYANRRLSPTKAAPGHRGRARNFRERFFAWRPYLHRYRDVDASEQSEQALIETGGINALAFRYIGATRGGGRP